MKSVMAHEMVRRRYPIGGVKKGLYGLIGLGLLLGSWAAEAEHVTKAATIEGEINSVDMQLIRQFSVAEYTPGQPLEVTITMSASAPQGLTAIGLYETLPPQWTFTGMRGLTGEPPTISPAPGQMGVLEFAWIQIPNFPYTFAYVVTPPTSTGGPAYISGQIEYRTNASAQKSPPVISELNGQDRIAPTIDVLGANPMQVLLNSAFSDPGVKATDNVDGDISNRVQTIGNVDTSTAGMYTLTYRVSDQAGNQAEATRSVLVAAAPVNTGGGVNYGGGTGITGGGSSKSGSSANPSKGMTAQNTAAKQTNTNVNINVPPNDSPEAALDKLKASKDNAQNKLADAQKHVAAHAQNQGGKPSKPAAAPADKKTAAPEGESGNPAEGEAQKEGEAAPAKTEDKPAAKDNTGPVAVKPVQEPPAAPPAPGFAALMKERFAQMTPAQLIGLMVGLAIALVLLAFTLLAWKVAYGAPPRRRPLAEKLKEDE